MIRQYINACPLAHVQADFLADNLIFSSTCTGGIVEKLFATEDVFERKAKY